jgi:protein-tyrosine phosphatase
MIRRFARWLRHLPDQVLHSRRRLAAQSRIAAARVRRILVVCHGNICRSPFGAALLQQRLAAAGFRGVEVSSAGFIGPGRPPPATAIEAAAARGVDLAACRSRLLDERDFAEGTLVLVMNGSQLDAVRTLIRPGVVAVMLGDLDPAPIQTRAIADPVDRPREMFDRVYERIDRCVGTLLDSLTAG